MRLTAQRVRHPVSHEFGINAYYFVHNYVWEGPQDESVFGEGVLMHANIQLAAGNNEVWSYLDVFASDGVSDGRIQLAFERMVHMGIDPPWNHYSAGTATFRAAVAPYFQYTWRFELQALLDAALQTMNEGRMSQIG